MATVFEDFLGYLERGATEESAILHAGYAQGFFCKQELIFRLGTLEIPQKSTQQPSRWSLPTDPFDRLVYIQCWSLWLEDQMWKQIHNIPIEMYQAGLSEDKPDNETLFTRFPRDLKEYGIEKSLQKHLHEKKGEPTSLHICKVQRTSYARFALQVLLNCSVKTASKLIREGSRISVCYTMLPSSKRAIKEILLGCGIFLQETSS